jgi:hypothetical protein
MTTEQGNGVATPDASGERTNDHDENTFETKSPSYESYRRVLSEKKAEAAKRRELEQRLAEIEAEKESQREADLREQGKFKDLLSKKETEYLTLQKELNSYKKTIDNSFKFNAIKKTLGAEIDYKWADFLEVKGIYDQVELDENRRPDELSVTNVCDYIRKEFPEMITANRSRGNLPNDPPRGSKGKLTLEEWRKLPFKDRKERMNEVAESYGQ